VLFWGFLLAFSPSFLGLLNFSLLLPPGLFLRFPLPFVFPSPRASFTAPFLAFEPMLPYFSSFSRSFYCFYRSVLSPCSGRYAYFFYIAGLQPVPLVSLPGRSFIFILLPPGLPSRKIYPDLGFHFPPPRPGPPDITLLHPLSLSI